MTYPHTGDLYSRINDPNEIILITRLAKSKRFTFACSITHPNRDGWRDVDDIIQNWKPLTKDNKCKHSTN